MLSLITGFLSSGANIISALLKILNNFRPKEGDLNISVLEDDRENDWLARQMREEAKIYKKGLGLDLGAAHEISCDAEFIKKAHHLMHMRSKEKDPMGVSGLK